MKHAWHLRTQCRFSSSYYLYKSMPPSRLNIPKNVAISTARCRSDFEGISWWLPSAKAWNERRHHGDLWAAWMVSLASWTTSRNIQKNHAYGCLCYIMLRRWTPRWKTDEKMMKGDTTVTQSRSFAESWPKIWWCHGLTNQKPIRFAVYFVVFLVCLFACVELRLSSNFQPITTTWPRPIHGYPSANDIVLPRILDFGSVAIGTQGTWLLRCWLCGKFTILLAAKITRAKKSECVEHVTCSGRSQSKVIPLSCKIPIQFEPRAWSILNLEPSPALAFSREMKGTRFAVGKKWSKEV